MYVIYWEENDELQAVELTTLEAAQWVWDDLYMSCKALLCFRPQGDE